MSKTADNLILHFEIDDLVNIAVELKLHAEAAGEDLSFYQALDIAVKAVQASSVNDVYQQLCPDVHESAVSELNRKMQALIRQVERISVVARLR